MQLTPSSKGSFLSLTVVVRVERRFAHPVMRKIVRRTKNYKAHDENNQYKYRHRKEKPN